MSSDIAFFVKHPVYGIFEMYSTLILVFSILIWLYLPKVYVQEAFIIAYYFCGF